jgi:exonuclease SbcC
LGEAAEAGDRDLVRAKEELERAADALEKAARAHATRRTVVEERGAEVPTELRTPEALQVAIEAARTKVKELTASLARAEHRARETGETHAQAIGKRDASKQAVSRAGKRAEDSRLDFEARCADAGFSSRAAYQKARAAIDQLEAIEKQVHEFHADLRAARERLRRAQEQTAEIESPDLDALSKASQLASSEYDAAVSEAARLKQVHESTAQLQRDFQSASTHAAEANAQYETVSRVAQIARGKLPPKLSFQRFVLAALLDEVLVSASHRLIRMSRGRYQLARTEAAEHGGRAAGLDLVVTDTYTGTSRPVATLSGGESFLAALALSLGLADVVQTYSGGIFLDTLFIDEGFGSLDPDALDLALDTLTSLNAKGRLVGIISHVPELQARISTRLEVTPTEHGSVARFREG